MDITEALEHSQPGLLRRFLTALQAHQLSSRMEQAYCHWITRYVLFHELKDPASLGAADVGRFVHYLITRVQVSRARLKLAQQALEFFYSAVLKQPLIPVERRLAG